MNDLSEDKLVSIIIPAYNGEKYIERCIRSLKEQTYKKFEIILVNDGSTDRTEEICLKLKENDQQIYYYYQENAGAGAARNMGLYYASGKYIMFVDCDDYLYPTYVEELYLLIRETGAAIACCSYYKGNDNDIKKFLGQKKEGYDKILLKKEAIASLFYRKEIMGYPVCKLFNGEAVKGIFFRTDIRLGEDFQYIFDVLCRVDKVAYLDKELYFYFQNNNGITHTLRYEDMKNAWCMIKEKMESAIVKESNELKSAVSSKLLILGLDYLNRMIDMAPDVIFEEELKEYIEENCMKVFMDQKCKFSNRILAGLCNISVKGVVRICHFIMELNRRMGIRMKKAV